MSEGKTKKQKGNADPTLRREMKEMKHQISA